MSAHRHKIEQPRIEEERMMRQLRFACTFVNDKHITLRPAFETSQEKNTNISKKYTIH